MNRTFTCIVCGNPANKKYTRKHNPPVYYLFYCSRKCKKSNVFSKSELTFAYSILFVSFITLFFNLILGFIGIIFSIILIVTISGPINSKFEDTSIIEKRINPHSLERNSENHNSDYTEVKETDERMIYSVILDKNVLPCCYLSARLNDIYCACGRALAYQVNHQSIYD